MLPERIVIAFSSVRDPRINRSRLHDLVDILAIALLAVLAGATAWSDMETFAISRAGWLRRFLKLRNGVPSEDTFRRVFEAISPREFGSAVATILEELAADVAGKVVAFDGKTMRGSLDRRRGTSALHVVTAWVTELGLSLGQIAVDQKSNEITAIPELLSTLDVSGATVTIDAMGCQRAIAEAIIAGGADYILAVKDNQPTLHANLKSAFSAPPGKRGRKAHATENRGHGRIERRDVRVSTDLDAIEGIEAWSGARSIVEVVRERTVGDKISVERAYYVSSLAVDAATMGRRIRSHWGIESMHWILDVTFGEDKSRVRDRNSAANLTSLRKLTASLLQRAPAYDGYKPRSIAQQRKMAAWQTDYVTHVLSAILH